MPLLGALELVPVGQELLILLTLGLLGGGALSVTVPATGSAGTPCRRRATARGLPPAPSPSDPGSSSRVASLDGLRGCAILLVVAAHAASPQVDGLGAAEVAVFFVLSGYLITTILVQQTARPARLHGVPSTCDGPRRLFPALTLLLTFETALRLSRGDSLLPVFLAGGYVTNVVASARSCNWRAPSSSRGSCRLGEGS